MMMMYCVSFFLLLWMVHRIVAFLLRKSSLDLGVGFLLSIEKRETDVVLLIAIPASPVQASFVGTETSRYVSGQTKRTTNLRKIQTS